MAYNLDKRTSRIGGKAAKTVFNIGAALVGYALGLHSSSKRPKLSGVRRKGLRDGS
jgi:hypothetical protein